MGIVDAVEDLEKAKSKLYDLKFEAEGDEKWVLAEILDKYIEDIQSVIDNITDDEQFVSNPDLLELYFCKTQYERKFKSE